MDTWEITILYDPVHTEDYIVKMLTACIPNISESKAVNLCLVAQTNGRSVVFSGFHEHAEHFMYLLEHYPLETWEDGMVAPPVMFELLDPTKKKAG